MGESREQKFWGLLNGTQTEEQKSMVDTYQPSNRATAFWNSLEKNGESVPKRTARIVIANHQAGKNGNQVPVSERMDPEYQQSEWLKKYRNMDAGSLYDAMYSMEDGNEKEWLKANAGALDGMKNTIHDQADAAEKAYQDYLDSEEYRLQEQQMYDRLALMDVSDIAPQYRDLFANVEDTDNGKKLKAKAEYLRDLADQYKMADIEANAETLAKQAEKEYQEYIKSDKYTAWKSSQEQAMYDRMALMDGSVSPEYIGLFAKMDEDETEKQLRSKAEYYRGIANQQKDKKMMLADMEEFNKWSKEDQAALLDYLIIQNQEAYGDLSQMGEWGLSDAKAKVNALYEKYGSKKVKEIAESYTRYESGKTMSQITQSAQDGAGSGFWGAAGHSLLSVPANLAGSVTSPWGYLGELTQRTGRYSTLDPNNIGNLPNVYSSAVRSEVAGNIEENGGAAGSLGSTLYQSGMSAIDNLARIVVGGKTGSLALAATGSFGQSVSKYSGQGATPAEAVIMGIVDGGLEVLTEKVSLDNLLNDVGSARDAAEIVKQMLIQGGIEVSEEEASFLGSTLAEAAILRNKSAYNQEINKLMALGRTFEEAKNEADLNLVNEAAQTAIQSFLSGSIMSGATSLYSNYQQKGDEAYRLYGSDPGALIDEALEIDQDNALAAKLRDKLNAGRQVSGRQLYKLAQQNEDAIRKQDISEIQKAAAARLTALGETENVEAVSEVLARQAAGQPITADDQNVIRNSRYGRRVSNELNPENAASGGYSSDWVKRIGTDRINAQAYNQELQTSKTEAIQMTGDIESFSAQFGKQAEAVKRNYMEGQDLQEYEIGFQAAYAMGLEGGKQEALNEKNVPYLSRSQREIAFSLGKDAAAAQKAAEPAKAPVTTAQLVTENGPTGDTVSIAEVVSMDDSNMTFKLEDGRTVTDDDLSFDNGQQVLSTMWDLGMDVASVNTILTESVSNTASDAAQASGIREAYHYGSNGYSLEQLTQHGSDASVLTDSQRKAAWQAGRNIHLRRAAAAPGGGAKVSGKRAGVWFDAGNGDVRAFDSADTSGLSKAAVAGAQAAQVLQKLGIGKNYYFYESYVNDKGERVYKDSDGVERKAPNGWYDKSDGSIHIDLNAGADGNGLTLFTLAHELTHFVEQWSPKKYQVLADFLVENYGNGASVDELVTAKQSELSESRGTEVSYEEAYSEFVADSMEAMLADGNVLEKLTELKQTDKSLFDKIREFFDNLVQKIREIYKDLEPDSAEGRAVLEMKDQIEQIQQLLAEALEDAGDNLQKAADAVLQEKAAAIPDGEIITDGATVTDGEGRQYSIRSMKEDIAEGKMFQDLMTVCNWTQAQVDQLRSDLQDLITYMTPFRDILDMNETYGREARRFSPYKPNSDPLYRISMDFSTLCSKRLLTQYVIENLQVREKRPMTAEEQMAIRDMLIEYRKQEKGLQVACAMCYVEAARLKSPKQISKWIADPETQMRNYFADKNPEFAAFIKEKQADFKESRGYERNATKKSMKPKDVRELNKIRPRLRSQYELSAEEQAIIDRAKALPEATYLTAGNLANLSETDPTIYAAYTAFVRTATRSKSLETDEPYYYGDSTRDNGNGIIVSDSFIEEVNRENGMRFSSWSDWRIQHMLDYITAVIDNAVRGAAMHGYTKFPEEVRVLGKTGMMFNMSGVAGTQTGLNPDGSLSFSPTESIDVKEAEQLREEFPETAGLQCIGVGDDHIQALMASDIIDYIIPYHTSGLNKGLRTMANIQGWADYTSIQNASIDKSVKLQDAADPEHWHEEPVFSEFFVGYDTGMTGIEAMRESADRYRQMCHDRGLIPKFDKFYEKGNNYWKLLIDRKMINQKTGQLIRQKPVTPTFDFDSIKAVVDRYVDNYDSNMEAKALNHIVKNWDSIPDRIKGLKKNGGKKTAATTAAVDTVANEMLAAQRNEGWQFSDRKKANTPQQTEQKALLEDKYYARQIDKWDGKDHGGSFRVGKVSEPLLKVGIPDIDIWFDQSKAAKQLDVKEEVTKDVLKKIPYLLEHPIAISESYDNTVMVFGEMYDENGNPIVVALRVNSTNRRNHITLVNKIRSVGTRTHNLDKLLSDDAILYLNETKKETNRWFNALGRSTPFGGTKFGLIRSISFDVAKSNIIGTDSENYSAIQNQDRSAGTSNRALLANAFEGLAQTPAEEQKIQEYRENVDLLNEQEKKLQELRSQIREVSFGKGERDAKKLQQLQEEVTKTANRIDIYDKRLLKLEAAKPLQDVLHREREKVRRETNQKNQETMKRFRAEAKAAYEGKRSDAEIMEKEFIRLMKAYEKHSAASGARIKSTTEKIQSQQEEIAAYKADMAIMEKEFMRAMKAYELQEKKNNAEWEKEFRRLLLEYDSAERNISRLEQKLENQRASAKNSILRRKESGQKRDARRKIRKAVMDLQKLLNRGNKKQNVKDGMQSMVSSSLKLAEALFMDEYSNRDMLRNGVGTQLTDEEEKAFREAYDLLQRIESGSALEGKDFSSEIEAQEYLRRLDGQLSGKMAKLKDVFARERKRLYGTTVSDLLGQLADEYSRLSEAEDGAVRAAKDENVYAHLLQLQKDVSGVTVRDMTLSQLEMVADAYTMVLTTVRNANKMFAKNLKFKRDTLSGMVMNEIQTAAKKRNPLIKPWENAKDGFFWNNLKPVYAFERLGSETLRTLYGNIRKGQDVWAMDMQEADAFRREQYRKHKRKEWDLEKQHSFEFESGKVELNLEQIMSLYAYSRREAALDHLLKGGFVFGGNTEVIVKKNGIKQRYLKKDATAYNLSATELMQVIDTLNAEQKAFVEEMQTYLSDTMGGKGNEVSMQLYGVKSFGEKNYFPLRSAGQYMEKAKEDSFRKEQGQISIVNSGFTKATTPHASNPITLDGFMDVWAEHVNDMSMYHGFVLPMEDFRRVYNYSTPNVEEGPSKSVNAAIENAFGKAATDYIDQLYKDLNGGAVSDNRENLSKKLVGLHKKASVFSSASVVIQQPSAFVRAFALIDPKHFIGPKVDQKRHKQLWAELKQYAPVAFVKEMGYFDTGMGRSAKDYLQAEEYSGIKEKMTALFKDSDYRDEVLGKAPSLADEMTWCMIWEAVKRETKARNYGLDPKSSEFLRIAGDRFSEVIDKTQVYDSVLSRSANMRSKSGLMNMVTSFMAEPTTSINMLEDALRKGNGKQFARTAGAVYGSVLLNALLVSLVYAARDDDEDKTYLEKYLSSLAVEVLDGINPITYYPFLRDVWSIFQGYDVERADMTLITDFANAAKDVISSGQKLQNASEGEEQAAMAKFKDSLWGMVDGVASLTGLPVKNIRRDINGARNMVRTISADLTTRDTTALSLMDAVMADVMDTIPFFGLFSEKNKRDRLYGAITAGDSAYVQRLRDGYESDSSYHSALRQALREHDSRIWEAAIAWNNNDLESYMRIAKEIRGENQFDQDDIVLAIRAEASAMEENDVSTSSKVNGYFTNEKFGVAMGQNNTSMADIIQKDLIDTSIANGKTREEAEESARSTARTQLKQLYAAGTITAANAEKMLIKYAGLTQEDAADKVDEWKYEKDYPELEGRIAYSQYKRWETDGKSRGVSLDTFTEVAEYRGGNTSSDMRSQEEVAAYINDMPISTAQKDALWCCFWSESTLYKNAPWH